jgi:hypothetical protein
MPLFEICVVGYLVIGIIVTLAITLLKAAKERTTGIRFIGDIASLHVVGFMLFLVLWPLWLALFWLSFDEPKDKES